MALQFKYSKYFLLTLGMIVIDQVVKVWVHYNIVLGQSGELKVFGDWFKLHYILNEGMAFGIQFGSDYGKLGLSLFRLVAMGVIAFYLYKMAKKGLPTGLLWCVALILGGAIGNVIDRIFYGAVADFLNMSCCGINNPYSFNIADIAIFMGAIGLAFFGEDHKSKPKKNSA